MLLGGPAFKGLRCALFVGLAAPAFGFGATAAMPNFFFFFSFGSTSSCHSGSLSLKTIIFFFESDRFKIFKYFSCIVRLTNTRLYYPTYLKTFLETKFESKILARHAGTLSVGGFKSW